MHRSIKKTQKANKKSLRNVSLSFSKQLCEKNIFIKPGQKICPSCRNLCEEKTKITENESDNELMIELDSFESRNVSLSQTNAALDDLGLTPIKLHNLPSHSKGLYCKRKVEKVTKEVKKKISKALGYDIEISEDEKEDERNFIEKAEDFDRLVGLLKEKLMSVGRSQKVQILTLEPEKSCYRISGD
ncbi:hypothetical protein QYM36_006321 [Artemia franciscana]|uniref:Uncharacterized protein n=1 Tax=Artemia franciscana TaxID=6661 RepID=A0AA88I8X9_ARTSF|nr:hypothetical protein QYM36_006321 [Artemia franciscana]